MIIAADINIPLLDRACEGMGELRFFDSRDLPKLREILRSADVLLCRSTIRVGEDLLAGTPVRFVATATSGTDHFDTAWLDAQGIAHASAAGSNARSVAEWWAAAMLELHARGRLRIPGATVGIVGVGHVGTEVADVARALGLRCCYNDPPRAQRGETPLQWSAEDFTEMEVILRCDVVTLHVPLTREGEFATAGFFGATQFDRMHPGALFVNTARGGVMEASAVIAWAAAGNPVMLDVFPGEPRVDPAMVRVADIATPHVAGHAWDGKLRGTAMVADALRAWLGDVQHHGIEPPNRERVRINPPDPVGPEMAFAPDAPAYSNTADVYAEVLRVVRGVYDVRVDDAALREAVERDPDGAAAEFARLRAEYRMRREFASCEIDATGLSPRAAAMLGALGFVLV